MAITARRSFGTTFPNGRFLHWSTAPEELFLSDEDKKMITKFIAENFPNGYTMSVDWESYKEFDTNPAFGKACKTYKVTFITES